MDTIFITMLLEAADSPNEDFAGLELLDSAKEVVPSLLEGGDITSLDSASFKDVFGPGSNALPGGFPEASIGSDGGFTFGAGDSSMSLIGGDGGSMMSGPMGDSMSSILQTTAGMPGGMGLIGSFFQFLGALLTNMTTAALDPTMLAQQAVGSMRKLG